jgi:hypothetical protein
MNGPYSQFKTDENLETKGIVLDYGSFSITVARAGGTNLKYSKLLKTKFEPHRRQLQTDTLDTSVADKLVLETYAEAVVLGWSCKEFGNGFIPGQNGEKLEFTAKNVEKLLTDLPELFKDIQEQSNKIALFRQQLNESDAKN